MVEMETATEENFNETAYLLANPDVGIAVMNGRVLSGWHHFMATGAGESRKQLKPAATQRQIDSGFLANDVPMSRQASHSNQYELIKGLCRKGISILEIGSRAVVSDNLWLRPHAEKVGAHYVGFDIYEGPNVDVAGDAHRLSSFITAKFDVIYSTAVFEHLAMPWLVAEEIAKCLKVGGHLFVETHFSWRSHERPWHFFQFSDMALRSLFSPALGFECIEAGASNPLVGRFSSIADKHLRYRPVPALYCHSEFFGRKVRDVPDFQWSSVNLAEVVSNTAYPAPRK